MRRGLSSWLFVVMLGACYDLDALDRDTGVRAGIAEDGDGSAADTAVSSDAPSEDADVDTGELLDADVDVDADGGIDGAMPRNGGFEEGTIGCSPGWGSHATSPERDPAARTGDWACKICANAGATYFYIISSRVVSSDGGEWAARAYFRSVTDGGPYTASLMLRHTVNDGGNKDNRPLVTTAGWTQGVTTLKVPAGSGSLYLTAGGETPLGTCLLVDDVELTFTP